MRGMEEGNNGRNAPVGVHTWRVEVVDVAGRSGVCLHRLAVTFHPKFERHESSENL